jgi:hypothetical protein
MTNYCDKSPHEFINEVAQTLGHKVISHDHALNRATIEVTGASVPIFYVIELADASSSYCEVHALTFDYALCLQPADLRSVAACAKKIRFGFLRTFTPFAVSNYMRANGMNIEA